MKTVIYGAGSIGERLLHELSAKNVDVEFFLDDDRDKIGNVISGKLVLQFDEMANQFSPNDVLYLCFPILERNQILEKALRIRSQINCTIYLIPDYFEMINLNLQNNVKNICLADHAKNLNSYMGLDHRNFEGKKVAVTGAGGSIGSRLCFEAILQRSAVLIINDMSEINLFTIEKALKSFISASGLNTKIITVLGNVAEEYVAAEIVAEVPDLVIHAAAYKHVEMGQRSVRSVMENNILATSSILKVTSNVGVENILLVSSDKAVNPTNVMGYSKMICEELFQTYGLNKPGVKRSIVRFGNVLGSSGSVIPIFRNAIKANKPITVRGENSTRYFMTIEDAASLICKVASSSLNGGLYILDMGKPVKIYELAKCVATLEGHIIDKAGEISHPIEIVSLLPGEKEHEELSYGEVKPTIIDSVLEIYEDRIYAKDHNIGISLRQAPGNWFIDLMNKIDMPNV